MENEKLFCRYEENAELIATLGILQENLVLAIREIGEKYGINYIDVDVYTKSRCIIEGLLKDTVLLSKI